MPKIRIKDLRAGQGDRKQALWNKLMNMNLLVYQLKVLNGAFLVISSDEVVERLLSQTVKDGLKKDQFEVQTPPEFVANKTFVIRNVDTMVSMVDADELRNDLERRNEWLKVEEVIKLPNAPKIIKVRAKEISMAKNATEKGILIYNQSIPSHFVEKEIFVQLSPCLKCYKYSHKTDDCPTPEAKICSECASNLHTFRECDSLNKKCINCGGNHRAFAARCPTRKTLIKDKAKEIRDRSRSRSRSQARNTNVSYAQATSGGNNNSLNTLTREDQVKINSAITYSLMMEGILPGSFQETVDEMYRLNDLPKVKFPNYIPPVQIDSTQIEKELKKMRSYYKAARESREPENIAEQKSESEQSMETEQEKRKRETPSPAPKDQREPKTKVRREEEVEEETECIEDAEQQAMALPSRSATPPRLNRGTLSLPRQQLLEGGGEEYAEIESLPDLELETQEIQTNNEKKADDMSFCFVITKDTTIRKGDMAEVKELLKIRKIKYVIGNPKYKENEARQMWERGYVDLRKTELKVISKELYNSIEINGKYLNLKRQSLGGTSKRK